MTEIAQRLNDIEDKIDKILKNSRKLIEIEKWKHEFKEKNKEILRKSLKEFDEETSG